MYRIVHPMNNNVALAKNEHHEEVILIGSGIAFNKRKGDVVLESKIEKIFHLRTEESKENFVALLKDVPLDFITITYDIIESLSKKYNYPVQEYIYITLADHIYCAYQAVIQGNYKESDLPDASDKYPIPYQISKEAVDIYRERILDSFPDDEISRIAFHFINAEGTTSTVGQQHLDQRKELLILVEAELRRNEIRRTKENSNFYDRFMIHLNYFLDSLDRSRDDNRSLREMETQIRLTYPKAYKIATGIYDIISRETGVDLYQSERVYLVLHIQRLL